MLRRRTVEHCTAAVFAAMAVGVTAAAAGSGLAAAPLIGTTYTHTAVAGDCNLDNPRSAIVLTYDETGGTQARAGAAGRDARRWCAGDQHPALEHDQPREPSCGASSHRSTGRLSEPYRTNLIRFTRDIRDAGFARFTVHFSPQWTNNPMGEYGPTG